MKVGFMDDVKNLCFCLCTLQLPDQPFRQSIPIPFFKFYLRQERHLRFDQAAAWKVYTARLNYGKPLISLHLAAIMDYFIIAQMQQNSTTCRPIGTCLDGMGAVMISSIYL